MTAGKISKALPAAQQLIEAESFGMLPPKIAAGLRDDFEWLQEQLKNIEGADPVQVTSKIASLKRWITISSSIVKQLEKM